MGLSLVGFVLKVDSFTLVLGGEAEIHQENVVLMGPNE